MHPRADQKTIKAAYHTLMFKCRCHPDLGGDENRARQINEAYRVLNNPDRRSKYDQTLPPDLLDPKRKGLDFIERRRIPRVEINFTVSYKTEEGEYLPARILDLSFLGCRLQTKDPVDKDTKVTINIKGDVIEGRARWKRMFHPTIFQRVYEAGVEFSRDFIEIDNIKKSI